MHQDPSYPAEHPLLEPVRELLDTLPAECRARVVAFYEKLQAQGVGVSAPVMVALLITEISEMLKAA